MSRRPCQELQVSRRHGFTLVEMMVTVAILTILAALAMPAYQSYLYKSKTMEAAAFLHEIRTCEEEHAADNSGDYWSASPDDQTFNPRSPNDGLPPSQWMGPATWDPNQDGWATLGPKPPGNSVVFAYNVIAGQSFEAPSWLGATDSWYIATAVGDLDGDGTFITFQGYSGGGGLYVSEASGWE